MGELRLKEIIRAWKSSTRENSGFFSKIWTAAFQKNVFIFTSCLWPV